MTLPEVLGIFLTLWLVLPVAGGITISAFKPETKPKPGSKIVASWSRDPFKDPRTFEFGWIEIGTNATHIHLTGSTINITETTTVGSMEVTYPFESGGPLFINDQEIDVESPTGGTITSSESSAFATTTSERLQATSETSLSGHDDPSQTDDLSGPSIHLTSSQSSAMSTSVSNAPLPSETQCTMSESQPSDVSQTHHSDPLAVVPVVAGTIGGVLMIVMVAFAARCYLRERRSGMQTRGINPFLTHESENRGILTDTDSTGVQQRSGRPGTNQANIDRSPDTELGPPPPVILEYTEDTSSATAITAAVRSSLEGPSIARAAPYRQELRVFTTDELAAELKQRLWEEGRWELDESLPGYPESDQGTSQ
ncbi:hypothetical protein AAF712_016556 [Marasmius tenuissimus]|uniref:Transmembrane protein n=1 Tax=Marasmius tenuissimus TaxID=585030 RepID=A0ABR2Z5P1_9AGAR